MDHPKNSFSTLVTVLVSLLVLLFVSVAANHLEKGAVSTAVALSIAAIKAVIVGYFFMDLRFKSPLVRLFAVAALFWLVIMFVLTFMDFLSRGM